MRNSRITLRLITTLGIFVITCIGLGVIKNRFYKPFLDRCQQVKVGSDEKFVRRIMIPFQPTLNNEDLRLFSTNALVFRKIDLIYIFYLDENKHVIRIEERKT